MYPELGRFLFVSCGSVLLATSIAKAREPLSFEDRVRAQEAIERVYHAHRIWPRENSSPKPPFEQMVPRTVVEAKVLESLKEGCALQRFWGKPLTDRQLRAEVERMARETRDPALLGELFDSLQGDPVLIAECLARPALADRLARGLYAGDPRIHAASREEAERLFECAREAPDWTGLSPSYRRQAQAVEEGRGNALAGAPPLPFGDFVVGAIAASFGGHSPRFRETSWGFLIERFFPLSGGGGETEVLSVAKRPFEDWWAEVSGDLPAESPPTFGKGEGSMILPSVTGYACEAWDTGINGMPAGRSGHTAVWTGTEMIVWGGYWWSDLYHFENTGGRYNPATDTWAPLPPEGAPTPRYRHSAVWTGTEMIVWGGSLYTGTHHFDPQGGRYSPGSDSWSPSSSGPGCPSGRYYHTAVWTGSEMIVWGGADGAGVKGSGGRYSPETDTWVPTPEGQGAPSRRYGHTAIWTGNEMVVWGGKDLASATNSGGRFDPSAGFWAPTPVDAGTPSKRSGHAAVWTGTEMIVWGGEAYGDSSGDGGRYDPAAGAWVYLQAPSGMPIPGGPGHTAVWTGSQMVVFGGPGEAAPTNRGFRYEPSTESWAATSTLGAPQGREGHAAVWTGTEMIVWGGVYYRSDEPTSFLSTGGRYDPISDAWTSMAEGGNAPSPRSGHTAIWTGAEMVIWGGSESTAPDLLDPHGGQYSPATHAWVPTAMGPGTPRPRRDHTAVWTGSEMIVWGGIWYDGSYHTENSGGRYSPSSRSWAPTSVGEGVPAVRWRHTAVWTGSEMVIWGGGGWNGDSSGGRYDPVADRWVPTSTGENVPRDRRYHTAVWTGSEMVIWGGAPQEGDPPLVSGGRYDPALDRWLTTSLYGAPQARSLHTAVWTGGRMVIFGGSSSSALLNTASSYDPAADSWLPIEPGEEIPQARESHSAVWTGSEMIIWGGRGTGGSLDSGARLDPETGAWTATPTTAGVPSPRLGHTAVWTGDSMLVWGGYDYDGGMASGGGSLCGSTGHPKPDFAVTCDPDRFEVVQGDSAMATCTVTSLHGFEGFVTLNLTQVGSSLAADFASNPVFVPAGGAAQVPLVLRIGEHAFPGTKEIAIAGMTATATRTTPITVTVLSKCIMTCQAHANPAEGPVPVGVYFHADTTQTGCFGDYSYSWDFGDGSPVEDTYTATHTYEQVGRYTWTFTYTIGDKTCTDAGEVVVDPPLLGVSLSTEPVQGQDKLTARFRGEAYDGTPPYAYQWDFGDGTPLAAEAVVVHTYASPGRYTYTFKAWDAEGRYGHVSGTAFFSNCALACAPAATPASGLLPLGVAFQANATAAGCVEDISYSWNFDDGQQSSEENPTHTFPLGLSPGERYCSLWISADGAYAFGQCVVTIEAPACQIACSPTATPDPGGAPCQVLFASTVDFTSCTGEPDYLWEFGDGTTSSEANPVHVYPSSGWRNWTLTVTRAGARCVRNGSVYVPVPDCQLSCSASVQPAPGGDPYLYDFSAAIDAAHCPGDPTFRWDFGDGWVSTLPQVRHRYSKDELYNWKLQVGYFGESCTRTGEVIVGSPPCRLTASVTVKPKYGTAPLTVTFTTTVEARFCNSSPVFLWTFGDGQTSSEASAVHVYTQPGDYSWKVTVTADSVTWTKSGTVNVYKPPCTAVLTATAEPSSGFAPLEVQFHGDATLSNCSGDPSFTWTFGDGATATGRDAEHIYVQAGTYSWWLRVKAGTNSFGKSGTVTVVARIPGDCDGDGSVSIGEVQKAIGMFLGTQPAECGADCDGDGAISIGEVQKVIAAFLGTAGSC